MSPARPLIKSPHLELRCAADANVIIAEALCFLTVEARHHNVGRSGRQVVGQHAYMACYAPAVRAWVTIAIKEASSSAAVALAQPGNTICSNVDLVEIWLQSS
jgi:hypothetical protein